MHEAYFSSERSFPPGQPPYRPDSLIGRAVPPFDPKTGIDDGQGTSAPDQLHSNLDKDPNEVADTEAFEIPLWKRVLDLSCILLSLPLWLPVVALVFLWIKIVSPGPVFFRQQRVGHGGRVFMLLKFRTMKVNSETASHERHLKQLLEADRPMTKLDASGDPRIIPGGRILRASGLDELAQLFNVLRGEMTLVGPRPCTPHEFRLYQTWQRARVCVQPGLTGYWQVSGKNRTTFSEMIKMDIFYAKNLSIWLDLWIIFKTPGALVEQVRDTFVAGPKTADTRKGVEFAAQTEASDQSTVARPL